MYCYAALKLAKRYIHSSDSHHKNIFLDPKIVFFFYFHVLDFIQRLRRLIYDIESVAETKRI